MVIVVDDVGFSDFGCYGGEIPTPHIDRLASDGLRYTNFRTTGVCSATRACLLTGLNPHSAGIGWLAFNDGGFPGYRGDLAPDATTLAEAYSDAGYATYHVGKWHVNAAETTNSAGPAHNWPPQRGYTRSHWFQGHSTDYFNPAQMYSGTERIAVDDKDYYVTDALTDNAVAFLHDHVAQRSEAPFFMTLAHPAAHSPLQAPEEDIKQFKGWYDQGWDKVRDARLAKQHSLGLFDKSVALPALNPGVKAWDALSKDEQRLYAYYMEVYAAVIKKLDDSIGRVTETLEKLGIADNTMVVLISDNGGSPDGGFTGTPNLLASLNGGVPLQQSLDMIDKIGGADSYPMYPMGWATASNTPFRLYKHTTHLGGVADPLIVKWPEKIKDKGAIRSQFVHVIDILPTLLSASSVAAPAMREGKKVKPIEGRSFLNSFEDSNAPDARNSQYYEMNGLRAFKYENWRIVSTGRYGAENDRWELFDLSNDPNETRDLAAQNPQIVARLEKMWDKAARAHNVFPIDLRSLPLKSNAEIIRGAGRSKWHLYPPVDLIPEEATPRLFGRSFNATINLGDAIGKNEGVLIAHGNQFLGVIVYVRNGELALEYHCLPKTLRLATKIPSATREIVIRQIFSLRPHSAEISLICDGKILAQKIFDNLFFGTPMQGLQVGENRCGPVSPDLPQPFRFGGSISKVTITTDNTPYRPEEITAITGNYTSKGS